MDVAKGQLFIGIEAGEAKEPFIFDSADFTTHGVVVGMTGSGKTGLAVTILEEALLSGIPCFILDPKGDMGNLLLNFPDFAASDFRPWVDEAEAVRKGMPPDQLAAGTANAWKEGLAGVGITPERMRQLRDRSDMTIYTPGSRAGVGLNVLGSMKAPSLDWGTQGELINDEIEAFVSSLLSLAGIESDPVSGPEHILLSTIIESFWREERDLDLATLVGQVPKPPFRKLGVFDVDTFFPEKDRMALAMKLNGLLASPSFATWLEGAPLDVGEMLSGGDKTRAAIVYLSHLSDAERMFVVTLLFSKIVSWFRTQPGTSDLRALVYMDEVFGYVPPTAEPPSKKPILTILKQARAHGVGLILSTQNPVDLDYKAMSNASTWMVGRLQTENDKRRILEGVDSATGGVDIDTVDKQISDLEKRQFVMASAKATEPTLFGTRWAMSYLAGPLTRERVSSLMEDKKGYVQSAASVSRSGEATAPAQADTVATPAPAAPAAPAATAPAATESEPPPSMPEPVSEAVPVQPKVAEGVQAVFLDPAAMWAGEVGADPTATHYQPAATAMVNLLYDDTKAAVNHQEVFEAIVFPLGPVLTPESIREVDHDPRDFRSEPPPTATYALPDAEIDTKTYWANLGKDLTNHLIGARKVTVYKSEGLKLFSRPGETREDFEARVAAAAGQAVDDAIAKLRDKHSARLERAQAALAKAENRVADLEASAGSRQTEELLSGAGDLIGMLLGKGKRSNPLGQAARRRSASSEARARAENAKSALADEQADLEELKADLEDEVADIEDEFAAKTEIEEVEIPLEKTDVRVAELKLVWIPTG
jgi:DNA helicase HerA-like ATPase